MTIHTFKQSSVCNIFSLPWLRENKLKLEGREEYRQSIEGKLTYMKPKANIKHQDSSE